MAIVGAGAMGGLLGARFHMAGPGHRITLIDHGPHLAALREDGLKLIDRNGDRHTLPNIAATDDYASVGAVDLVVLGVKAHQVADVAPHLPALFHDETIVLTLQNGIPWWYFERHGGEHDGTRLQSLDPKGVIQRHVPAERIVGAIAYPAGSVDAPGVVRHVEGDRIPIGELDGSTTPRAERLVEQLTAAGFRSRVIDDIRAETWLKAIGNLAFNPISALTRATMAQICRFPPTRELAARMMQEALDVAVRLGITVRKTIEDRLVGAERVGEHKTSMLQDVEAGRPLELAGLVDTVLELAALTGTSTPAIETIHACCGRLNASLAG